jgi:hypothetical protein
MQPFSDTETFLCLIARVFFVFERLACQMPNTNSNSDGRKVKCALVFIKHCIMKVYGVLEV